MDAEAEGAEVARLREKYARADPAELAAAAAAAGGVGGAGWG